VKNLLIILGSMVGQLLLDLPFCVLIYTVIVFVDVSLHVIKHVNMAKMMPFVYYFICYSVCSSVCSIYLIYGTLELSLK
jgi:hypothetical protein